MITRILNPTDGPVQVEPVAGDYRAWLVFYEVNMKCRYMSNGTFPHWSGSEGFDRQGGTTVGVRLPEGWVMQYKLPNGTWTTFLG